MTGTGTPAAVRTFAEAFAAVFTHDAGLGDRGREYHGRDGVRVNCILPGNINTPVAMAITQALPGWEEMVEMRNSGGMLGKPGDAWDIALACVYLASDEAKYVTGHTWPIDSGSLLLSGLSLAPQIREIHEPGAGRERGLQALPWCGLPGASSPVRVKPYPAPCARMKYCKHC